jgi:hypothetical protein
MQRVCMQFPYQRSQLPDVAALASERVCCPDVRTDADCLPTPCLRRKARIFLNPEVRLDGCNLELFGFLTLMGARTHDWVV